MCALQVLMVDLILVVSGYMKNLDLQCKSRTEEDMILHTSKQFVIFVSKKQAKNVFELAISFDTCTCKFIFVFNYYYIFCIYYVFIVCFFIFGSFSFDANPDGPLYSKWLIVHPVNSILVPGEKSQTVSVTFKPDRELAISDHPILKCQV